MANCYYHPESKAKFVCPDCGQDVCDQCRIEGGLQRCGHCATHGPPQDAPAPQGTVAPENPSVDEKAGQSFSVEPPASGDDFVLAFDEPSGAPPPTEDAFSQETYLGAESEPLPGMDDSTFEIAGSPAFEPEYNAEPNAPVESDASAFGAEAPSGFDDFMAGMPAEGQDLVMCAYHGNVVADIQCLNCFEPYCLACLPTGTMCAACKADPVSRAVQSAPDDPVSVTEIGYEPGMDFAASYADHGGIMEGVELAARVSAAASGKPRKSGKKGGKKRSGAKKQPVRKAKFKLPVKALAFVALGMMGLSALGAGGYLIYSSLPVAQPTPAPFKGPTGVSFLTPKGLTIGGVQFIEAKVVSPKQVVQVEVNIDKKYWDRLKTAPYKSEWPTNVHSNGKHEVALKVIYKDGLSATAKKTYIVKNRKVVSRRKPPGR
ncbi:MAG: B-box zinc finger protein [Candidatus Sericytochromatia bacterium]|nr:B-box zinc finger protein [Candidatus Sericytochromatia bacterium]